MTVFCNKRQNYVLQLMEKILKAKVRKHQLIISNTWKSIKADLLEDRKDKEKKILFEKIFCSCKNIFEAIYNTEASFLRV